MASFKYTEPLYEFNPSPIKKIPTELLRKVFQNLKTAGVANMRLVCRNFAEVGAEFILPRACLIVTKDSFDRLLAISEHPIIHKYVKILCYTADLLADLDFEAWKEHFPDSDWTTALAGMEASQKNANHYFQKYQEYVKEQQRVLSGDYAAILATAISNVPTLKSVVMGYRDMRYCNKESQAAFADALADKGSFLSREATAEDLDGVPQMIHLLLGLAKAGTKLEDFICRTVSWRMLQCEETTMAKIRTAFSSLKFLELSFATGAGDGYDEDEPVACREYLRSTGVLVTFLSAAPLLTSLNLTFWNDESRNSIDIQDIVGNLTWPSLNYFRFYQIKADEDNWIAFCARHPGVKALLLQRFELATGTWSSTLQRIRHSLPLIESVALHERLMETETDSELDLDEPSKLNHLHANHLDVGDDIQAFFRLPVEDEVSFATFMAAPYYDPAKLYPHCTWGMDVLGALRGD